MNTRKLIGLALIVGMLIAIPVTYAKPNNRGLEMSIRLDSVTVSDTDGDGLKDSAYVEGTGHVVSKNPTTAPVTIIYALRYTSGPASPDTWIFVSRAHRFTGTSDGTDNAFDYTFTDLPYAGWYSVSAVAYFKGEISFSNVLSFDPPGGSGGPGGYD